jgi:hypothetical protein
MMRHCFVFVQGGEVKPTRPTEDVAFSVARWFARGGTYNAYYMWFGGTNFGRTAGILYEFQMI